MTDTPLVEVQQVVLQPPKLTLPCLLSAQTQVVQLIIQLIVRVFFHLNHLSAEYLDLVKFYILAQTKQPDQWLTQ